TTYTWDASGALVGIDNGIEATWQLTPEGTLLSGTIDGTSYDWLWDQTRPVPGLLEASGGFVDVHTNYGHRPLQLSVGDPDNPNTSSAAWLSYDHRGSTLANDQLPSLPDRYHPFGGPVGAGGDPSLGYRGSTHIAGHIWLHHRTYDPTTGTFLSPDPVDG